MYSRKIRPTEALIDSGAMRAEEKTVVHTEFLIAFRTLNTDRSCRSANRRTRHHEVDVSTEQNRMFQRNSHGCPSNTLGTCRNASTSKFANEL